MRHFLRGMASVPEWAPSDESHLLRSSSVVRSITYEPTRIVYHTFHANGEELLKLRRPPAAIRADDVALKNLDTPQKDRRGYTVQPVPRGGFAVRVHRSNARTVTILLGNASSK